MNLFNAPLGVVAAICLAVTGCASPGLGNESVVSPLEEPEETEEALSLTVDALDVRHGGLRIEASMVDGSADVAMLLGSGCPSREVGHGIATRAGFAWSLSIDDVAHAVECGLVVRARGVDDDGQRVRRVVDLPVSITFVPDGAQNVQLSGEEASGATTRMSFVARERATRLHIGGSVIGADDEDESAGGDSDATTPAGQYASSFTVDNDDLARSLIHRQRLTVLGEHFLATVTVGTITLDAPVQEATPVEEDRENTKGEEAATDCG